MHSQKKNEKSNPEFQILKDSASESTKHSKSNSMRYEGSESNIVKTDNSSSNFVAKESKSLISNSTESNQSIYGSLGGPTEEEICAANSTIFGVPQGRLGRIMRINIHGKPSRLPCISMHII